MRPGIIKFMISYCVEIGLNQIQDLNLRKTFCYSAHGRALKIITGINP